MAYTVWSDSLDKMVVYGFRMKLRNGGFSHYTWDDTDCLYWNDTDERYYMEVPTNAILDEHR